MGWNGGWMRRALGAIHKAAGTVLALAAALAVPCAASAQPGDGVRLGLWTVHPSVEGDVAYQTNVYLLAKPGISTHPDDWIFRVVPQINAERVGGRTRIKFYALYDWRQYAFNPTLDAHDNFGVGLTTAFDEDHDLAIVAEDHFRIQSRPNELDLFGEYHRDANSAKLATVYRPGDALEVKPHVFYDYDRFTDTQLTFAERHTAGVGVDARWAFLSRTVFVLAGEGGQVHYSQSITLPNTPTQDVNSGSTFWRAEAGVVGQMSEKINVALKGGYGQAQYRHNESLTDARGLSATAKADWSPRHNIAVSAGYERAFQDVFFTNFGVTDRLFAKYKHVIREELALDLNSVAEWQQYSTPFARRDFVVRIEPGAKRLLSNWAEVGIGYRFERRWSHITGLGGPASVDAPSSYVTHTVMATANFKW